MTAVQTRLVPTLAATLAAIAFSAAPAFAGSDGDSEGAPVPPPAQTVLGAVGPASSQSPQSTGGERREQGVSGNRAPVSRHVTRPTRSRTVRGVSTQSQSPQGGVQAGAGGMADQGSGGIGVLVGLAGGALVLLAGGGRLFAYGRRDLS
jgi:hypothetical protein